MPLELGEPAPIVIRKRRRRRRRYTGAWKVAFADFVTALMALFLVMWLTGSSAETRVAVASYFDSGAAPAADAARPVSYTKGDLENLAHTIRGAMQSAPDLAGLSEQVDLDVSADGLRIELVESEDEMFFQSGRSTPTDKGSETIALIAAELEELSNRIVIEGHTDAKPFRARGDYSNWELSSDRANAARRLLVDAGLDPARIVEVRGVAATRLRKPDQPEDPSNRRISLIVRYNRR